MSTQAITEKAFSEIEKDMNEQTTMLSNEQINALAKEANDFINLPVIGEKLELIILAKVIRLIDKKLYQLLPNEYYKLINNMHDGLSAEEAAMMEIRLTKVLNQNINIPFISEKNEADLIGFVLSQIIKAMLKGATLAEKRLG